MNNESFYMHPRYDEFTAFLKTLNTDAKITPSTKHLAFDVWSKTMTELCGERWLETGSPFMSDKEQIEKLKADLDRLHRERDSFQRQASVLAEEVERLNSLFLAGFNHAVGERGDACLSIDGGNL